MGKALAMKVCFLGSARYSQPLSPTSAKKFRLLKTLGELFVIGFSGELKPGMFTEHARFYLLSQLPLPVLRYLELFFLGQILLLWLIVRHRIQVVVAQSPYEGFVAGVAIKLAAFCGRKVRLVVEVHGDFERSLFLYRKIPIPSLYRFLMKRAALYSIRRADSLRAISNSTKEQLKRWAPGKTIIQFPTWTDIDIFLETRANRDDDVDPILYAGVLTPLKGIHYLLNAFAAVAGDFPRAQLFIVGKEEHKRYATDLRNQVRKHRLEDRVHFIGPRSQSELATWMTKASVLVLPSTSEGLGRVIIEAMATGTPVIGSRVGGIPELIEDGARGFLVAPANEKALAEKIHWILSNPVKARAMGERARAFAEGLFSTEHYLKGYKEIFDIAQQESELREHAPSTV
jgi:glycosyltransferase involved in cell wall biosynthesis